MHDIQVDAENRNIQEERAEEQARIEHMTPEEFGKWLAEYDRRWFADDVAQFASDTFMIEDSLGKWVKS